MISLPKKTSDSGIAIVGMAGRFPGANDVQSFWQMLVEGRSGVTDVPDTRARGSLLPNEPNYVPKSAVVKNADHFDAAFFGIYPKQAQEMDPQHRLFLETAWLAMEDAGYTPDESKASVGVFAGCHMNTYIFLRLAEDAALRRSLADTYPGGSLTAEISNDKDYLATRVAFQLNLRGPSIAVQSACSTSLVAIARACQSLEAGECEMALAGGATITFPQEQGYLHTEDSILSPDGSCRTFDANAKGTIFGDGVGALLLKRVDDAIADGDDIYAVIKGWGVNNDGSDKAGYTAPSIEGQKTAIVKAHEKAGISADSISYVEAHGTGTLVGDPIEVQALTDAFRETTDKRQFCRVASVKTNVGHLDVAAGVTGAIKTALALKHRQLPASLNFQTPNPKINFDDSPFIVNDSLTPWEDVPLPRRAGISSFGVGGTNAHLVIEEAPTREATASSSRTSHLLPISAKTPEALDEMTADLAAHLSANPDIELADVAYTLQTGRKSLRYKRVAIAEDATDAARVLRENDNQAVWTESKRPATADVIFMFPGQGSQHVGMARELYREERVFAKHIDECAGALKPHLNLDLRTLIYDADDETASQSDDTIFAQSSLFMISYAMGKWLQSRGIQPTKMIGHSVGEFSAAAIAGVMTVEDAAMLVATRGRLMQALPSGSMLAVRLAEQDLQPLLHPGLEIAAINAPEMCAVSGPTDVIEAFQRELESGKHGDEIVSRRLRTSHAFHSAMMDPAVEQFREVLKTVKLAAPQLSMISTVTTEELTHEQATDIDYWAQQIRAPVRFSDTLQNVLKSSNVVFVETGPNQALSSLARQQSLNPDRHRVQSTLPHVKQATSAAKFATAVLGKLWLAGVDVDFTSLYDDELRQRVHLPTYRFQRKRHWFVVNDDEPTTATRPAEPTPREVQPAQPEPAPHVDEDFRTQLIQQQMAMMNRHVEILRNR